MELKQLEYFLTISKLKSFTMAADQLYISQPGITSAIRRLEDELGVELFAKKRKTAVLTPEGKIFANHIENVINDVNNALHKVEELKNLSKGTIHVGISPVSSISTASFLIAKFNALYPDLELIFAEDSSENLQRRLEEDELDIAFLVLDVPNETLDAFALTTQELVVGLPSFHMFKGKTSLTPEILQKEKPHICIGFGNYISVPLIKAAYGLAIPTMIHEQNSFAGKANRYLAKYTDAIVGCYQSNLEQFPKYKTKLLGNPEASIAAHVRWDKHVLTDLGLQEDIPFVLFMMGSLGSSSVSKVIDEVLPLLHTDYQVVVASGKSNEYVFHYSPNERVKIVEFVNGKMMLKGCALAVLRAGATTMAEIGAIGTPSILIPSPYVPNNHQYHNAMELVKENAATMIEEKDLNAKNFAAKINTLMTDFSAREEMHNNAVKQGKVDAAKDMIAWMKELTRNG